MKAKFRDTDCTPFTSLGYLDHIDWQQSFTIVDMLYAEREDGLNMSINVYGDTIFVQRGDALG